MFQSNRNFYERSACLKPIRLEFFGTQAAETAQTRFCPYCYTLVKPRPVPGRYHCEDCHTEFICPKEFYYGIYEQQFDFEQSPFSLIKPPRQSDGSRGGSLRIPDSFKALDGQTKQRILRLWKKFPEIQDIELKERVNRGATTTPRSVPNADPRATESPG